MKACLGFGFGCFLGLSLCDPLLQCWATVPTQPESQEGIMETLSTGHPWAPGYPWRWVPGPQLYQSPRILKSLLQNGRLFACNLCTSFCTDFRSPLDYAEYLIQCKCYINSYHTAFFREWLQQKTSFMFGPGQEQYFSPNIFCLTRNWTWVLFPSQYFPSEFGWACGGRTPHYGGSTVLCCKAMTFGRLGI
jgi:hypothetical protein